MYLCECIGRNKGLFTEEMNSRLSHHSVASLKGPNTRMSVLKNETGLNNSANTELKGGTGKRGERESLHREGVREPQTHSSSRAYAGATRAASGRIGPAPERASDFNALDSHYGEPKSPLPSPPPPRTLAQQIAIDRNLLARRGSRE